MKIILSNYDSEDFLEVIEKRSKRVDIEYVKEGGIRTHEGVHVLGATKEAGFVVISLKDESLIALDVDDIKEISLVEKG